MTTTSAPAARTFTAKGRATRERIVIAASRLVLENGVERTTVEDVRSAAGVNTSQLYHYFADKSALMLAVIDHQGEQVLSVHRPPLERLDSFEALHRWRDMVVDTTRAQRCAGGCPIGSLASELAETDLPARDALARWFEEWEQLLVDGLARMQQAGVLGADVDTDEAALALLAAVQGGLLLSQTRRDTRPLEAALDSGIRLLRLLSAAE
jgi:AcrR family transcriptional regulator